jgi:hypothetical protein
MMSKRAIDLTAKGEDWFGNNIAVTCPCCSKVYLVSAVLSETGGKKGERQCPDCKRSTGVVHMGDKKEAYVMWDSN